MQFRLPAEYPSDPAPGFDSPADSDALDGNDDFYITRWLDDNTVALMGDNVDDIIACHLSDGERTLAVDGPPAGTTPRHSRRRPSRLTD